MADKKKNTGDHQHEPFSKAGLMSKHQNDADDTDVDGTDARLQDKGENAPEQSPRVPKTGKHNTGSGGSDGLH